MKNPTFSEGVLVALAAGLVSSVTYTVMHGALGLEWTTRILVAGLSLGYVLYLLHRSQERTGRFVTLTAWFGVAGASWFMTLDPLLYLLVHLSLIWLVRALYHQTGPLAALFDLGLNLLALMAGYWAFWHADSIFMGVWTFFLVQATFIAIPSLSNPGGDSNPAPDQQIDHFHTAYRSAEAALRKLSANQ